MPKCLLWEGLKTDPEGNILVKASPLLKGYEDILFNREEVSRLEVAQPASKVILGAYFESRKVNASLRTIRFGKVQYINPLDGNAANWVLNENSGKLESRDQLFSAKWVTDLNISYKMSNHFMLTIGARNIFNVYPDKQQHSANISNGLLVYSRRVQQFGVKGAFWFTKLNLRIYAWAFGVLMFIGGKLG